MQERRIDSNEGRKNTGLAVRNEKKPTAVKKTQRKSVSAQRASSMHAVRAPKVVTIKNKNKSPFPWSAVIVCVLFTCMFLFMMMNYAEVNKYQKENAELDKQIASMQKQRDELQVTLNDKCDLAEIGEYASQMGMIPSNQNTNVKVITIEQDDKIEMHAYEDGDEGGIGFLLTGLAEVVRDFID